MTYSAFHGPEALDCINMESIFSGILVCVRNPNASENDPEAEEIAMKFNG